MTHLEDIEERLAALEALEERVRAIEELEEIKKLHRNYAYWMSNNQWEEMIECFSDDAVADAPNTGVIKGKKAIAEMFRTRIASVKAFQKGGHLLIQPVISVEKDTAKGYWSMYHFDWKFESPAGEVVELFGPDVQAKYDCEYVKENGKWKFGKLKFIRPWPEANEE